MYFKGKVLDLKKNFPKLTIYKKHSMVKWNDFNQVFNNVGISYMTNKQLHIF